jgi:16S rRNA (guanine527-N7)-methyltransferase
MSRGNLPVPPDPLHRSADADERLCRWLRAVVDTPGLTALKDLAEARRVLLEDSLRGVGLIERLPGPVVDVGSGGGAPGIPLAHALPDKEFVLVEAERRKADFLERWAPANARVTWSRAEEQPTDWAGVAVAKALAQPPVAAELCLPLVRVDGIVVLWVGPSVDVDAVDRVAAKLAADLVEDAPPGFVILRKFASTPAGFPRRPGLAKKRPLA